MSREGQRKGYIRLEQNRGVQREDDVRGARRECHVVLDNFSRINSFEAVCNRVPEHASR